MSRIFSGLANRSRKCQNARMVQIKLAKTAGFCWGVKRAIDITVDAARGKSEPIYTYGPLIHNPQLIKLLESKNIHVKDDPSGMQSGEIIIRTHGITPEKREALKGHGLTVRDATCPLVARVQGMIKKFSHKGYSVVIVGDDHHAEVVGLQGYAQTPVYVVASLEEAKQLPDIDKVFICAQTTCDINNYQEVVRYMESRYKELEIGETICDATNDRQGEVIALAREVDAMVVVGGKNSANTARLAMIAEGQGIPAFHIETEAELDMEQLMKFTCIGVTAGASTPKWVIDNVVQKLESIEEQRVLTFPFLTDAVGFLVKSEFYLAVGAAALTYANMHVMGATPSISAIVIAFCAILSTYLFNQLLRPDELKRSKYRKYLYHLKFSRLFMAMAIVSAIMGLVVAFQSGYVVFALYIAVVGLGGTYGISFPGGNKLGFLPNLKNIPASKDVFVGTAWVIVTVVVPYLSSDKAGSPFIPGLFTFGIAYVRTVLFDLRDIYTDQIVGKESVPMLVGKDRATSMMYGALLFLSALLLLRAISGLGVVNMLSCLVGIVYLSGFIYYNQNNTWAQSAKFDLFLDAQYYVVAALIMAFGS